MLGCSVSLESSPALPVDLMVAAHSCVLQDGSQLRLSEADRKALVFGLALHEKGKATLEAGKVQVSRKHTASTQSCCKHTGSLHSSCWECR